MNRRASSRPWLRRTMLGVPGVLIVLAALGAGTPSAAQPTGGPPAAAVTDGASAGSPGAPALEAYRFNPRERTARALAAWEKGRPEEAVAPLDSALRLRPGDPLVEFNAGTAHLGAQQPDAAHLLEQAAKHAPPELAADALYNLGNARLSAKNAQGAIDAYKGALRAQPDLGNAKRNLELAVRLLEEQQQQQKQQQQQQQQQDGENDPSQQDQQKQPGDKGQGEPAERKPNGPQDQQQQDPSQQGEPRQGEGQPRESPLPQFQEQQDMTAEQAAAILQAVENLERQQRRDQARAVARAKTSVEKDW